MHAALRPYITAGIALVGASVIAVTPVTPSLPGLPVEQTATRLLASSIANIPANLVIAIANIPYYESLALKEYAYALGPAGQTGGVPGWIPPGATVANGGVDPGPDGIEGTEPCSEAAPARCDDLYTRGGTGSWYMESHSGNTWGWDDGNWPQLAGIGQAVFPFEISQPIAQQLQTFAQAELIAGAAINCEFQCADVLGYLVGWLVFQTPLTSLLSGTTFPVTINAYPDVYPVWSCLDKECTNPTEGQPAQLNLLEPLQALATDMMEDPSLDEIKVPNLADIALDLVKLNIDFATNFNPFVTGSFLYWGAPTFYSLPAGLAGVLQNFTGIPNQFLIDPWQGDASAGGGIPPGGETLGPASLLTGVPAGWEYLGRGLLGYLNPSTYLGISLGNTLLRTYAAGSLPGSGIAEQLLGIGVKPLLDAVGIGGLLPSESFATSFASPDAGSTKTGSGQMLQLSQQQIDSTDPNPAPVLKDQQIDSTDPNPAPVLKDEGEDAPAPKEHKGPILNFLTNNGNSAAGSNAATVGTGTGTGTNRRTPVKDAVKQAGDQLKKTADDVHDGLKEAADNVRKTLGGDKDNNDSDDSGATP